MPAPVPSATIGRVARVALVVAALSAVISVRAAEQPADVEVLARSALARYDVVLLRDGIALAGKGADRRVEIARGVILSDGTPLSGSEVRRRFGADADLVLKLSYLDDATLHRIFRPAAASPAAVPAPPAPQPPAAASAPASTPPLVDRPRPSDAAPAVRRSGARIGVAKRIVVAADEEVRDAVVSIGAPVRIDGRVRDGVVVLGGDLELAATADVRGDITVIGGALTIADGARHSGAVHHAVGVGWPRWSWSWPSFGWARFEPQGAGRWLPLAGTTSRLLLLSVALFALAALASGRLQRIGAAAADAPVRSAVTGFAIQVLFVPVLVIASIVLAVTIVGLPFVAILVPLAVVALFVTMLVGFASLALRLGSRVLAGGSDAPGAITATLTGMVLLLLPTLVARLAGFGPDLLHWPVMTLLAVGTLIEYVAWTIGLGAAARTGLGRWSIVPPPIPPVPPVSFDPPVADAPSAI